MASFADIRIRFQADLKQFSSQMQNAQRSLAATGKNLQNVGKNLTLGLSAPLVGLGALSVKVFADFEQEMAKVAAISGATASEFEQLTKNAQELGRTTRFTASEVAALQLNYSKLGFNPGEILQVTQATLNLALATGEDLANSATVAASTLRGFGLDASETGRVTDVMAKSFSSSALDLEKFSVAMSVLAPVAKTAGLTLEEATGKLAVLINAGLDASTAGTGLRNIFLDLAASGQTYDEAIQQIATSSNKNATAVELFGKRGATVASVLADNVAQANNFTLAFNDAGGSAQEMATIMDNTLQGSFFRLKSALEGLQIAVGEQLAPFLTKVADGLGELAAWFTELSPATRKFIVILGGIAAAIGPLLALAGTILPAIGTGFALLTGPIGLIVAGLTAVGVIIYRNWQPIKQTLIDIANYFIDLYNESTVFRIVIEAISTTFKNLYEVGRFVFGVLGTVISTIAKNIRDAFGNLGQIIKAVLTGNFQAIPALLAKNFNDSIGNFREFIDTVKNDFGGLKQNIGSNISEGINNALNGRKYKISAENMDAEPVTEKVSEAVKKGLEEGLNQPQATQPDLTPRVQKLDLGAPAGLRDLGTELVSAKPLLIKQAEALTDFEIRLAEFNENTGEILERTVENFATGFANIIGGIVSGTAGLGDVASFLLRTMGDLAQNLGRSAIQIGVTMKALRLSFKTPFAAIAAGAALVVLGALLKTAASNFAGNFSQGGIVPGSSFTGDRLTAGVNSGELILNVAQQKRVASALQRRDQQAINGVLTADGRTLKVLLQNVDAYDNRVR